MAGLNNWCLSRHAGDCRVTRPCEIALPQCTLPRAGKRQTAGLMMTEFRIRLDVPLVPQMRNKSCWYAAACMVSYYREAGPRPGLSTTWQEDTGVDRPRKAALARNEDLEVYPLPIARTFTNQTLYEALNTVGPLWADGDWFDSTPHVIVVTGIDGDTVYFNDPAPTNSGVKDHTMSLAEFNRDLFWGHNNSLLCRRR